MLHLIQTYVFTWALKKVFTFNYGTIKRHRMQISGRMPSYFTQSGDKTMDFTLHNMLISHYYTLRTPPMWSFVRSLIGGVGWAYHRPEKTPGIHTLNPLLLASHWWSAHIYPSASPGGWQRPSAAAESTVIIIIIIIIGKKHAFQSRTRHFPALRKHVRERGLGLRRRGADGRGALAVLGPLQPAVRDLGLQLHQPRGQVRVSAAESQEAPERFHHLDQRGAQEAGTPEPRPGEHGSEQNTR